MKRIATIVLGVFFLLCFFVVFFSEGIDLGHKYTEGNSYVPGDFVTLLILLPMMGLFIFVKLLKFFFNGFSRQATVKSLDEQNMAQYFIRIINSRFIRTYSFILAVYFLAICIWLRLEFYYFAFVVIPLVIFIISLTQDLQRLKLIKNSDCRINRGIFNNKSIKCDGEGDCSYWVVYHFTKTNALDYRHVSRDQYKHANKNDLCYQVIFSDPKKNFAYAMTLYEINGKLFLTED